MKVIEIFNSIQGEGTMLGEPAVFIRLAGCNLRCPWCDTKESWQTDVKEIQTPEIVKQVIGLQCDPGTNVIITGGEPCLQEHLSILCHRLQAHGFKVCLETNGTLETPVYVNWVTCSPKPEVNYMIHEDCSYDELKYVVTQDMDLEKIILPVLNTRSRVPVWLQPNGYDLKATCEKIYDFVLKVNSPRLRMGVQLHKVCKFR